MASEYLSEFLAAKIAALPTKPGVRAEPQDPAAEREFARLRTQVSKYF